MATNLPYRPLRQNRAIHPGRHLVDELDARGLSSDDLAGLLRRPEKSVKSVLRGRAPITKPLAAKLERALGIEATFWRNLQASYDEALRRLGADPLMSADIELLDTIPWRTFQKQGWIEDRGTAVERVGELRTLYDVDALSDIENSQHAAAFRITKKTRFDPWALAAWLQQGEWQAIERRVTGDSELADTFDQHRFAANVRRIRGLTRDAPFWPAMRSLCGDAGVHLELVPHVPKSGANGVTRWLDDGRPLIQLSLFRGVADTFWFTFFHEAAHVLAEHRKDACINLDRVPLEDDVERDADRFARDILIPLGEWQTFCDRGRPSRADIVRFADDVGVHPGIVVGRLQHEKLILHSFHNDLRAKLDYDGFAANLD